MGALFSVVVEFFGYSLTELEITLDEDIMFMVSWHVIIYDHTITNTILLLLLLLLLHT